MWTAEFTVEFVPLPPEKEQAYWAAIDYFAEIIKQELTAPALELEAVNNERREEAVACVLF